MIHSFLSRFIDSVTSQPPDLQRFATSNVKSNLGEETETTVCKQSKVRPTTLPPTSVLFLIPRTCRSVTLYGKMTLQVELRALRWGDYPRLSKQPQSHHTNPLTAVQVVVRNVTRENGLNSAMLLVFKMREMARAKECRQHNRSSKR